MSVNTEVERLARRRGIAIGALLLALSASAAVRADDMLLADYRVRPGVLLANDGRTTRAVYRRLRLAGATGTQPIPCINSIAIVNRFEQYFCSGLDLYILRLSRGEERVVHTARRERIGDAIRDVASTGKPNELFYSVVATPQDGAPLADGVIHALNTQTGAASRLLTVRQADVDHAWWGAFAYDANRIHLGTMGRKGQSSKVYSAKFNGEKPTLVYELPDETIYGLAFHPKGDLYVANGGSRILGIQGMRSHYTVLTLPSRHLSGIAFPTAIQRHGLRDAGGDRSLGRPATAQTASISGQLVGDKRLRFGTVAVYRSEDLKTPVASRQVHGDAGYRFSGLPRGRYVVIFSEGKADSAGTRFIQPPMHRVALDGSDVVGKDFRVQSKPF